MKFDRRSLLKGVAGTFIALPFLESVALAATSQKRFITVFTPNGVSKTNWKPKGSGSNFSMSPILQPLEPHRDYLNILDGLDNRAANCQGHDTATLSLLTGMPVKSVSPAAAGGISIDQVIAKSIGAGSKVESVQLGVKAGPASQRYISHAAAGVTLAAENNPMRVYSRLFGGGMSNPAADAALQQLRKRRKAVMDGAMSDIASLRQRISQADKARLDAHLDSIRELEKALDAETKQVACTNPANVAWDDNFVYENANFEKVLDLQTKFLVHAMRCDITRVASLQWSESTGAVPFTWLGITTESHELSHRCDDPDYVKVCTWYSKKFGDLLTQLRDPTFKDGNGKTLLDNTLVLWVNELSSCVHDCADLPVVLAGKGGTDLKTNRFIDYGTTNGCPNYGAGAPLNQLFVSLMNMFGIAKNQFGDPSIPSGPLAGLL